MYVYTYPGYLSRAKIRLRLISNLKPFDHVRSNKIQKDHPSFQLPSGYLTIRHGIDGP